MKNASLPLSAVAWHMCFMRKANVAMDAGEWDSWFDTMTTGQAEIEDDQMPKLRCSCCVRAVMTILESAPDNRDASRDSWRAVVDLIDKVLAVDWLNKCGDSFRAEVESVRAMALVGVHMHHSDPQVLAKAEAFKRSLATSASKNSTAPAMYFAKILTQCSAGVQLSVAISEVTAAMEKVAGWTDDLESAVATCKSLPDLPADAFLSKDFDVTIPHAPKVADVSAKLGALLTASTDKFQSEHQEGIICLKKFQFKVASLIKSSLARRVFLKVPSLHSAIVWSVTGCQFESNAQFENHMAALAAAKSAVGVKSAFAKHVGTELAKCLQDYMASCGRFLGSLENFCKWVRDAESDQKSASLAIFKADEFADHVKWFHDHQQHDEASADQTSSQPLMFQLAGLHQDAPSWISQMKAWLFKWCQGRLVARLSSCQDFVHMVLQKDVETKTICKSPVCGTVDADEDIKLVRDNSRELASICCTVCFHDDFRQEFDFGSGKVDMESLCCANIYLPAARYAAAVIHASEKVSSCASIASLVQTQNVDQLKQPGQSRTECSSQLLSMTKRWIEAGMLFLFFVVEP